MGTGYGSTSPGITREFLVSSSCYVQYIYASAYGSGNGPLGRVRIYWWDESAQQENEGNPAIFNGGWTAFALEYESVHLDQGDRFRFEYYPAEGDDDVAISCMAYLVSDGTMSQNGYASLDSDLSTSSTEYLPINGAGSPSSTLFSGQSLIPCNGEFSNLSIKLETAPGSGKSRTFTVLKNGVATDMVVTISGTDTYGYDNDHEFSVSELDSISVKSEATNSPSASGITLGISFRSDLPGESFTSMTMDDNSPLLSAGNTYYVPIVDSDGVPTSTVAQRQNTVFMPIQVRNFAAELDGSAGNLYTFNLTYDFPSVIEQFGIEITIDDTDTNAVSTVNTYIYTQTYSTQIEVSALANNRNANVAYSFYKSPWVYSSSVTSASSVTGQSESSIYIRSSSVYDAPPVEGPEFLEW